MINLTPELMLRVEKPARYTGNEWNARAKPAGGGHTRFAFCYPDVYEVGMSHIGLRILYEVINRRGDACCERVFAPWTDMERLMRDRGIPLFGLESREPVAAFDFIGFTLQYELCYTNVLNMLDLAGLDPLARRRGDNAPVVIAGGPCVCNPAPMSDFIDLFTVGEGEEVINEILDLYGSMKKAPAGGRAPKSEFLREASRIEGVYVPAFPPAPGRKAKKRIIRDMDSAAFPERGLVPNTEIVHDRITLELFRGCIRGCRFCQAGYIYRPVREKRPETLRSQAAALVCSTGYDEISLSSLSSSDYTQIESLADGLSADMSDKRVNLSLPSLRADAFSIGLAENASNVRKSGLTFAPEAGTQRLRDVINKGVTEEDLLRTASLAFGAGWGGVKLYFMIGLPTETYEDLDGIAGLVREVIGRFNKTPKEKRARVLNVGVSAASFVPKPFTPFQWEAQDEIALLREKQKYLKEALKIKHVKFSWHEADESFLEAVFARGGRETGRAIYEAWRAGAKFDGWSEHFDFGIWTAAFERAGVSPGDFANKRLDLDARLPWDIMDYGITKEFLAREREAAIAGRVTPNCRIRCAACGISDAYGCDLRDDIKWRRQAALLATYLTRTAAICRML